MVPESSWSKPLQTPKLAPGPVRADQGPRSLGSEKSLKL